MPLLFVGLLAMLAGAMLVPLPPSIWTAMPGRDLIEPAAAIGAVEQPWRPWALVPPLAHNALYALIPPSSVLLALLFLTPGERIRLIGPFALIIVLSAVLGVAQMNGGNAGPLRWYAVNSANAGIGFFANRNHQALLLAMGFPVLAAWAFLGSARESGTLRLWLASFAAVLLAAALLTTGSRAGLVLGLIAVAGTIAIHFGALLAGFKLLTARMRAALLGAGAAGVAIVAFVAVSSPQAQSVVRLFGLNPADDLRARAFPTMIGLLRDYFPFGTGFGGFEPAFRAAEPFDLLSLQYLNEAHNDYLQLAIEAGVAGLAILIGFAVWYAVTAVGILRRKPSKAETPVNLTGTLMVLLIALASIVDYPVRTPLMMVTLVLACAWMVLPRVGRSGGPRES
ncbi:O-antigen ligase family protein [Altererythrobacter sp. TH136]|uniref:O-antigen ligase family protein n=1 Tax=Altererythrobacter sp. TH136 TaxID=2067415 RepID=UPI00143D1E14|nr:O-antigen ligase family protein [Altererythrobacter sp. TH136]